MRICVIAGMIDAKLHSKLSPLQNSSLISQIHLIRRQSYSGNKIRCHTPPAILLRWLPLAEIWRLLSLLWICLRYRPEILIAFGTVPHGVYAWLIGKMLGIPVIQHVMGKNDLRLTFSNQAGKKITLAAVRNADLIAVRGQSMAKWLMAQGVPPWKIFSPQNVHDFSLFTPNPKVIPEYDLVYVGLLAGYKRVDLLLAALAKIQPQRPGCNLLLLGDGPLRDKLQKQAVDLGIEEHVTFFGRCKFAELPEQIQRARIFVMTSQGEGLPMAMIEAMSCGLPAIVPMDADIQEIAIDHENALLVPEWEAVKFAETILKLLDDTALYAHLKNGALKVREQYANEFSLEYQTEVWNKALTSSAR